MNLPTSSLLCISRLSRPATPGYSSAASFRHYQLAFGSLVVTLPAMRKHSFILFISILICSSSWAQESKLLSNLSPKLGKFLADHPTAMKTLTSALADAFSGRTYGLYDAYSDDESEARAFHFYPDTPGLPDVLICVRENQLPFDEFASMLFEIVNSKGENQFAKLCQQAKAGSISRSDFAREILKVEFGATKTTRDLIAALKLDKKEMAQTHYFSKFMECPNTFEDFLTYPKEDSHHRDVLKEYESKYDALRNTPSGAHEGK